MHARTHALWVCMEEWGQQNKMRLPYNVMS